MSCLPRKLSVEVYVLMIGCVMIKGVMHWLLQTNKFSQEGVTESYVVIPA